MKKNLHGILTLMLALFLAAGAQAAADAAPWPTHAPEATPYIRLAPEVPPMPEAEEPAQISWDDIFARFGSFSARKEELALFRSLPQDEPYAFVPHSDRFELDEGEALRMAELFDALEGVEARVIAMRTVVGGAPAWDFLTVVTMTPARLFELSEELGEHFLFEQFYESVRLRFDIDYWPGALYEETEAALAAYEKRGCFCFEADTLKALEGRSRDETLTFALQIHTPDGWSEDAQQLLWILRGREGVEPALAFHSEGPGCLCLAKMDLATLSVLSDTLPGRYLVRLADEETLAGYDRFVTIDPVTGEVVEG